jgi:hypothetical protein
MLVVDDVCQSPTNLHTGRWWQNTNRFYYCLVTTLKILYRAQSLIQPVVVSGLFCRIQSMATGRRRCTISIIDFPGTSNCDSKCNNYRKDKYSWIQSTHAFRLVLLVAESNTRLFYSFVAVVFFIPDSRRESWIFRLY